ncbi:hypothetical protein CSUB01_11457 [Colletotrichum sublineola]|uniref:Uncharacterized protein n=1 Tax=Colletotrichum sublineola TaxID=1173701 RepID=A0A066XBD3_COLSU|nr:hypothetical protein CSUB01_11457 [Colletotrichum sublineola]
MASKYSTSVSLDSSCRVMLVRMAFMEAILELHQTVQQRIRPFPARLVMSAFALWRLFPAFLALVPLVECCCGCGFPADSPGLVVNLPPLVCLVEWREPSQRVSARVWQSHDNTPGDDALAVMADEEARLASFTAVLGDSHATEVLEESCVSRYGLSVAVWGLVPSKDKEGWDIGGCLLAYRVGSVI